MAACSCRGLCGNMFQWCTPFRTQIPNIMLPHIILQAGVGPGSCAGRVHRTDPLQIRHCRAVHRESAST